MPMNRKVAKTLAGRTNPETSLPKEDELKKKLPPSRGLLISGCRAVGKLRTWTFKKGLTAFCPPEQRATVLAEALPDRGPPAIEGSPLHLDSGSNIHQVLKTKSLLFLKSLGLYRIVLCLTTGEGTWSCGFREGVSFSVVPLGTETVSLAAVKAQSLWSAKVSHTAWFHTSQAHCWSHFPCHYPPSPLGSGLCSPVLPGGLMACVIIILLLILLDKVSAGKRFWIGSPAKRNPFGNALLTLIVYTNGAGEDRAFLCWVLALSSR